MVAPPVPHSGELVDLVIAAQGGEAAAFTALVVRFQRLAIGLAVGWLGDIELNASSEITRPG